MKKVIVRKGTCKTTPINNETFELVRGIAKNVNKNGSFILVKPTKIFGDRKKKTVRINVTERNI